MMKGSNQMKTKQLIHVLTVSLAFCFLGTSGHAGITITVLETFDYPGGTATDPEKINDRQDVAGLFAPYFQGFVRFGNGTFSPPIIEPNDISGFTTVAWDINNSRTICGAYTGSDGLGHGFFRVGTTYTEYDVLGLGTAILGINNAGDFSGWYADSTGFLTPFINVSGTVMPINIAGSIYGYAYELNDSNAVCGYYADASEIQHGFYQESTGALHFPIDPPGSTGTNFFAINDKNWIVGNYLDASAVKHGLLFIPPRRFVTFDYPGGTGTGLTGINLKGFISGHYRDSSLNADRGFIAQATRGPGD
jgi:hypothetical protein